MNPTTHHTQTSSAEDATVAFCQHCGRPLNKATVRVVGPAVYCEPCLAARLNGAAAGPGYQPGSPGTPQPGASQAGSRFPTWTASSTGVPNPNLAGLLGFIPGVGAMYNEQYAKGIAHLFIFAVLVSLSHISEVFGLLLSGWICYMAIEAHHTAKARRDGRPLPNPFGLNDIGERLGFDANLRRTPDGTPSTPFSESSQTPHAPPYGPPSAPPSASGSAYAQEPSAYRAPEPVATWGAPADMASAYASDPASAAYTQTWPGQPPASASYAAGSASYAAVPAYGPHIDAPPIPIASVSRFPAGAIGLMVLGTIFLLGTTGILHNVSGHVLVGLGLIGLGGWIFTRRFISPHAVQTPADAANYRLRTVHALTPSIWLVLIGTLILLDALTLMRWSSSWPWIIIVSGFLLLLKRTLPPRAYTAPARAYTAPAAPTPPLATDFSQPSDAPYQGGRE